MMLSHFLSLVGSCFPSFLYQLSSPIYIFIAYRKRVTIKFVMTQPLESAGVKIVTSNIRLNNLTYSTVGL